MPITGPDRPTVKNLLDGTNPHFLNDLLKSYSLQMNIRSYPTTVMYNSTKPHSTSGFKTKDEIKSFIEDVRYPPVIDLNFNTWTEKIKNKKVEEVLNRPYFLVWRNYPDGMMCIVVSSKTMK